MLRLVGFPDPEHALQTYPFELSGGLRQRAMIAMALVCRPALLIADEPTTALDVTIQAQILKLLKDLQAELGMAVLLITHDLGVVANMADEVVVMYRGQVMEAGTVEDVFEDPRHPYLKALLHAVPRFDMKPGERLQPLREIQHTTGHLLARRETATAGGQRQRAPLLAVEGLTKAFRTRKAGLFGGRGQRRGAGGRRRQLRGAPRRMPGAGRRIGLRQDHAVEADHARAGARFRRDPVQPSTASWST